MKFKARLSLFATVLILAVTVAGCPPPPPNPIPDPGDAGTDVEVLPDAPECLSPASCACETLCRLGCEDCLPECVETIEHIILSRIIAFDPECVAKATTKEEVRKCPAIRCR